MRQFARLKQTVWLEVVLAVAAGTSVTCLAQEVGAIDLTQVERRELRRPAAPSGEASYPRGGTVDNYPCRPPANAPRGTGALLRTTLLWLDRNEVADGDYVKFEMQIENVGSVPVKFPFSPHLADLQPEDPGLKFGFAEVGLRLQIGGENWTMVIGGGGTLYGADQFPETMLLLRPGNWVRVTSREKITVPEDVLPFIRNGAPVTHANAEVSIHQAEMLLGPAASATVARELCLVEQRQGPNVAITLTSPK